MASVQPTKTNPGKGHQPRQSSTNKPHRHDDDSHRNTAESDGTSLYSSASEDVLIHAYGHTYHGSGRILTPNDASDARRERIGHELLTLCLGGQLTDVKLPKDRLAPDGPGIDVLDIGSGAGCWATDMALTYPNARVLGIDLSNTQMPKDVPINLTFEMADAAAAWPDRMYDLIRVCNIVGGGIRDWPRFFADIFDHLRPGGQIEFIEVRPRFFDVDPKRAGLPEGERPRIGTACQQYNDSFAEMCAKLDIEWDPIPKVVGWLTDLGAESIRERVDWIPVATWGPDELTRHKGFLLNKLIDDAVPNQTFMLFGQGGWSEADTRDLLRRVLEELQDPALRSVVYLTFITARKAKS